MYSIVFDVLWTCGALVGIIIQIRAIMTRRHLLDTATQVAAGPPLMLQLRNDLLLYKIRLGLIVNNLMLGISALVGIAHVVNYPLVAYGVYATLTVVANEVTLVVLAWRDQYLLTRRHQRQ